METPVTGNLAEAIREIEQNAALSHAHVDEIEVQVGDETVTIPYALIPTGGGGSELVSFTSLIQDAHELSEKHRLSKADRPDRRQGTAHHQALTSFIDHADRFKSDASAIWADARGRVLQSVLDYHPKGADSAAAWGRHRGIYPCPLSEAWKAWGGGQPVSLSQDDFAALLDSRDRELSSGKLGNGKDAADPATLITLANNLEVFSNAMAKRERDPNTGRLKISFNEEKGVSGTVMPPPGFLVLIPVFQDSQPSLLEIRLRVAVEEQHAVFTVQIHAAAEVLRQAFDGICNTVADATQLPLFVGTPE